MTSGSISYFLSGSSWEMISDFLVLKFRNLYHSVSVSLSLTTVLQPISSNLFFKKSIVFFFNYIYLAV